MHYKELEVWKKSIELVKQISALTIGLRNYLNKQCKN